MIRRNILLSVGDTPIVAQATNFTAFALMPFTNQLLATFTNGVPGSDVTNFSAFINWGDNSTNSGVIVTNLVGQKEVLGAHTYTNAGTYPVYITIQSYLGVTATAVSTASVSPGHQPDGRRHQQHRRAGRPGRRIINCNPTPTLLGPSWQVISNFSSLNGYNSVVTNSTTNGTLFYRLKK